MENRELHPNLQAALQLVEGIFQMLGSRYEVILHDLSHVESSIVALAGDVTHRKIGGPVTNYLLQLLQKYGDSAPNSINYRNVTTDGRILRSSTIFIRDENGHIVGSLCINQDLTDYIVASRLHQETVLQLKVSRTQNQIFTKVKRMRQKSCLHMISVRLWRIWYAQSLEWCRSQLPTCRRKISLVLSEIWRTEAFLMSKAPLNMWQSVWVLRILPFTIT